MNTFPWPSSNDPDIFVIDYLPLMHEVAEMSRDERLLKQELAKTNYTNIHKKRKKR